MGAARGSARITGRLLPAARCPLAHSAGEETEVKKPARPMAGERQGRDLSPQHVAAPEVDRQALRREREWSCARQARSRARWNSTPSRSVGFWPSAAGLSWEAPGRWARLIYPKTGVTSEIGAGPFHRWGLLAQGKEVVLVQGLTV